MASKITLEIDGRKVSVPKGLTVLDAADKLDIHIPTMCFRKGLEPYASCMVCVVRDAGTKRLLPSCSSIACEGMRIDTCSEGVVNVRRAALELLLSEHSGNCEALCRVACPAYLDVPGMIRLVASGRLSDAAALLRDQLALPGVIGRVCAAPCRKACRRGRHDESVGIRDIERYVSGLDASGFLAKAAKPGGKRVAIIGSGPAGLSTAFHLSFAGHACVVFEKDAEPGGNLRKEIPPDKLPMDVLDAEISIIRGMGCEFRNGVDVVASGGGDGKIVFDELCRSFDAVVVAAGAGCCDFGLETCEKGLQVRYGTFETSQPGVFAGGDALVSLRQAVRAVSDGKSVAESVKSFLLSGKAAAPKDVFDSRTEKVTKESIARQVVNASPEKIAHHPSDSSAGYSYDEAKAESERCLDCDCRKASACTLRELATEHSAKQSKYKSSGPLPDFPEQTGIKTDKGILVFQPGKCIKCGVCVRISQKSSDTGLTFVNRGIATRVLAPLEGTLESALVESAEECVEACPTAALSWMNSPRDFLPV